MLVSLDDNVPFPLANITRIVLFSVIRKAGCWGFFIFVAGRRRRRGSVRLRGEEVLRDRDRYSRIKEQRSGVTTFLGRGARIAVGCKRFIAFGELEGKLRDEICIFFSIIE